jgi:hypothetical protein
MAWVSQCLRDPADMCNKSHVARSPSTRTMNKALTPSHPAKPQHNVPVTTPATADMAARREPVSAQRTMKKKLGPGVMAAIAQIAATVSKKSGTMDTPQRLS